ncbi:hypothetical protein EBZ57_03880 [bacterium]|nr:hypothetical protein [bacterium]
MNRAWSRENTYEGTSGYTDTSKSHHLFYELSKGSQTVQQGTQTLENIKHGEAFAPPVISGAIGGVAGAAGAGWGAYMEGANAKGIARAALVGASLGAVSGALFQPHGFISAVAIGAGAGALGGGLGSATNTYLTNQNATKQDYIASVSKGAFAGAISGTISAPFGVPTLGGGIASAIAGAELGLASDIIMGYVNSHYDVQLITKTSDTIFVHKTSKPKAK